MSKSNLQNLLAYLTIVVTITSCNSNETTKAADNTAGSDSINQVITWFDSTAMNEMGANVTVDTIASGYDWSEGALWLGSERKLLFSDVPTNKIFQWIEGDSAKLYLTPSGFSDVAKHVHQDGSNGLALDKDGKLIICQSGDRQIARMLSNVSAPVAKYQILASSYKGKRFNSPNDLVADKNNNIYFTDPIYGLPGGEKDSARQIPFEGVFKINAAGELSLLVDSIPRPNGVTLSPDQKTLYIASSDENKPAWYAYSLDEKGDIGGIKWILSALPYRENAAVKQSPDGLKTDKDGRIFSSGPEGISIISAEGKRLALIRVEGRPTSNCSFNANTDTLYITADDLILRSVLHK